MDDDEHEMWKVLEGLLGNPHIDLGGLVYMVRDKEVEVWDGPAATEWSESVQAAKRLLDKLREKGRA